MFSKDISNKKFIFILKIKLYSLFLFKIKKNNNFSLKIIFYLNIGINQQKMHLNYFTFFFYSFLIYNFLIKKINFFFKFIQLRKKK
jgi:hypothetical protein